MYPHISEKRCIVCGGEVVIKTSHQRNKKLCSTKCRIALLKSIKEENNKKKIQNCEVCGKTYISRVQTHKYCSRECYHSAKIKEYDRTCQNCGKTFKVHNISQIQRGDHKFCSQECSKRKFKYDEFDFTTQTPEGMYWLGFIYAAVAEIQEESITLVDTEWMLNEFSKFLNSDVALQAKGKMYKITLNSRNWMRHLSLQGIRTDYYKEAPIMENWLIKDFIRGYFDSHKGLIFSEKQHNIVALHGEDSKLMRYFSDMLDAKLTYKEKEWIVVCKDFEISCNGFPKNKKKWKKFNSSRHQLHL